MSDEIEQELSPTQRVHRAPALRESPALFVLLSNLDEQDQQSRHDNELEENEAHQHLRVAKKVGFDIGEDNVIRKIRFPLHDHCKKNLGWSNAQVLMRFVLLQLIIMPALLILLIKIR